MIRGDGSDIPQASMILTLTEESRMRRARLDHLAKDADRDLSTITISVYG
jgi:hypothetical protein